MILPRTRMFHDSKTSLLKIKRERGAFQRLAIGALTGLFLGGMVGCASPGRNTGVGAGVGAAAGAAMGAVIGHQSGNRGKGALIGAAAGALLGGGVGNYLDKQAEELKEVAETRRTEHGIVTKLKGDILFDSGQAIVKPGARTNINKIADIIKKYPEDRLTIVGHTDSTGNGSINQRISEQRAQAVKLVLVKRGVSAQTISVVGMGESQPVASNKTAVGRSHNRRVEIEITVDESKAQ